MADVKTELTVAEALKALELSQEAVRLACEQMDRAEKDMEEAYAAMRRASRAVTMAKARKG